MKTFIVATLLGLAAAAPATHSNSVDIASTAEATVADVAVAPRQEEAFLAIVKECQIKVETGVVDSLDDCVLDALGIQRRQVTGDLEKLEQLTGECTEKFPGDVAKIYQCVVEAIGIGQGETALGRRQ